MGIASKFPGVYTSHAMAETAQAQNDLHSSNFSHLLRIDLTFAMVM